jgi:hypothetical protein
MEYTILGVHVNLKEHRYYVWVALSLQPGQAKLIWRCYTGDLPAFPTWDDIQAIAARGDGVEKHTATKLFPNLHHKCWEPS